MASFCANCGAALNQPGGFCGSCGHRNAQAPAAAVPSAPTPVPSTAPAAARGTSGLKIAFIVIAVLGVFAVIAVGSIYYVAHRFVKSVESATGVTVDDIAGSVRAAAHSSERASDLKRNGCELLSKEDASAILGTEIERMDGKPNPSESGEHCEYFVKPGTVEQDTENLKKAFAEVQHKKDSTPQTAGGNISQQARNEGVTDLMKNMTHTMANATSDGAAPYFFFLVERENGKLQYNAFKIANALGGGEMSSEAIQGVGDRAYLGPMDSMLCVVKGNSCITLMLGQVPDGKAKGIALAKKILDRL